MTIMSTYVKFMTCKEIKGDSCNPTLYPPPPTNKMEFSYFSKASHLITYRVIYRIQDMPFNDLQLRRLQSYN